MNTIKEPREVCNVAIVSTPQDTPPRVSSGYNGSITRVSYEHHLDITRKVDIVNAPRLLEETVMEWICFLLKSQRTMQRKRSMNDEAITYMMGITATTLECSLAYMDDGESGIQQSRRFSYRIVI